ncbi:hypothetical protein JW899_00750 [Candidatus Uhrbacteria bacterium]|nr:hypothetical protein [Candidatus Uhrbacteria bacterium]
MERYPFVSDILSEDLEPLDGNGGTEVNELAVSVETADGNLMFRRANNVGLGDSSFAFCIKGGKHEGQVMKKRGEYFFAVDGDGKIINRLNWPRNDGESRQIGDEIYAHSIFWVERESGLDSTESRMPIWDKVRYLVWVTVEAWHAHTKGELFSESYSRSVRVTIYRAPGQGFRRLYQSSSPYRNLSLDKRMVERSLKRGDCCVVGMLGMLYELGMSFRDKVCPNGVNRRPNSGGRVFWIFENFWIERVVRAGHDRITIGEGPAYITGMEGQVYVVFEFFRNSDMNVPDQRGTVPQIRNLVRKAMRIFEENPRIRRAFRSV